jgi:hypothetical protein
MHKANAPRFCAPGDDVHLEKSGIPWWWRSTVRLISYTDACCCRAASKLPSTPSCPQDHRSGGVAVEQLNPPVHEAEDVAAGRVHPVSGRRQGPLGEPERTVVSPLQCQLDDHYVTTGVHVVELAMHVRECRPVVLDGLATSLGPRYVIPTDSSTNSPSGLKHATHPATSLASATAYACLMNSSFVMSSFRPLRSCLRTCRVGSARRGADVASGAG